MGNLTTAQLDAIIGGNPIKQQWWMKVPLNSVHSSYYDIKFEEGIFRDPAGTTTPLSRIIKAGKRKHRVWNPHPNIAVKASALRYRFEVSNEDGYFNEGTDSIFYYLGLYDAAPQECFVKHQLYVWEPVTKTWSNLVHMNFIGQIIDIDYEDGAAPYKHSDYSWRPQDTIPRSAPDRAVVTCEQHGIWNTFRRAFEAEDADRSLVDDPAGLGEYYIDVVLPP